MLEKLKAIEQRLTEVEQQLSDPAVYGDRERLTALSREQKELTPVVACYRAYLRAQDTAREAEEMLTDPELRALAQEELAGARADMERLQEELKRLLLPRDPNDEKNVILEIRAGIGGEEGALFAADLLRMYTMYAERRGKPLIMGECGAKNHPTFKSSDPWGMGDDDAGYDLRFRYLVSHAFGTGATALLSWHWRDPMEGIFPCGLVHAGNVPRPTAHLYAKMAKAFGRLELVDNPPDVIVLMDEEEVLHLLATQQIVQATMVAPLWKFFYERKRGK